MTDICRVEDCDRPVSDAYSCTGCAWKFEKALGNGSWIGDEIDIVLTRQSRYEEHSERTNGDRITPLFFDDRASEAGWVLRNTLSTWVRLVAEERGYGQNGACTPRRATNGLSGDPNHTHGISSAQNGVQRFGRCLPDDSVSAMSRWLLTETEWIRHHSAGHEAVEEITAAVREVLRVVDRPDNRTTFAIGPCPEDGCDGEVRVYIPAREDRPAHMDCAGCGARWESMQFMNAGKRIVNTKAERLRPYVDTATAAVALGVTDRRIRQMCATGTLTNHGTPGRILLDMDEVEAHATHRDDNVLA